MRTIKLDMYAEISNIAIISSSEYQVRAVSYFCGDGTITGNYIVKDLRNGHSKEVRTIQGVSELVRAWFDVELELEFEGIADAPMNTRLTLSVTLYNSKKEVVFSTIVDLPVMKLEKAKEEAIEVFKNKYRDAREGESIVVHHFVTGDKMLSIV